MLRFQKLNTDKTTYMEVKRYFGRIISTILHGMVLFILSANKKRGRKPSLAALVFSHASIYKIVRFTEAEIFTIED